jgi:hypothetical protein
MKNGWGFLSEDFGAGTDGKYGDSADAVAGYV